jgi:hypothetical protein
MWPNTPLSSGASNDGELSVNDALDMVWRRAELPNHVMNAAELARWHPGQRDAIIKLGLLRRTSDATALICEDCGQPHPVEVIRDSRRLPEPYYLCAEIGRVPLRAEDLQRWEADFDQIAVLIRRAAGLTSKAATLVTSRIWLLGRQRLEANKYWELFLVRGLCWPDGLQLLDRCARLQQSPGPVVMVPCRLPSGESAARSFPIRTLSEIVSLDGSGLVVDLATLATAVGSFGIVSTMSGKKAPRKRMSRSFGTPEAVRVMTEYLQHETLTDTQFGNQFNTTDRTVRNFRNTGKMRSSNFEAMAKSMRLTAEQLLRGELPPSMKSPTTS